MKEASWHFLDLEEESHEPFAFGNKSSKKNDAKE